MFLLSQPSGIGAKWDQAGERGHMLPTGSCIPGRVAGFWGQQCPDTPRVSAREERRPLRPPKTGRQTGKGQGAAEQRDKLSGS